MVIDFVILFSWQEVIQYILSHKYRLETSNSIFSLILRHQTISTRGFLFMSIAYEAGAKVLQIIFTIGGGHQQSCVLNRTCALKSGSIFQFGRGLRFFSEKSESESAILVANDQILR